MDMFFRKDPSERNGPDQSYRELWSVLSRYAGVGLWDAVLANGDPAHAASQWRWSQEFRRLLGFAPDDTTGFPDVMASWADRLHPEDAEPTFQAFGACLNDRTGRTGYDVSYRLRMKGGDYRWFRAIGGVARGPAGNAERACGALIDIDDERNALERSDVLDRFAGVGLWDAVLYNGDPMHRQSHWHWSPEFRRLLGFNPNDTAGFPDVVQSWSNRLHPDDAEPTFQAFAACLNDRSGATGYDVAYRLKVRDGSYRWFRAVGGVARNAAGMAVRACGSLIDINDQKLKELATQTQAETYHRISVLAESLSAQVAETASEAAQEVSTVADAAEDLATSIADITNRATHSAEASAKVSDHATSTGEIVERLVESIRRIDSVVKLIDGIAGQTNLLALNATIEAARAGELGKGFAVVATEVKMLAKQSSEATQKITDQINTVQQEAQQAGEAIESISALVENAKEIGAGISDAVGQQDQATQEISQRISLVAEQTQSVSKTIEGISREIRSLIATLNNT